MREIFELIRSDIESMGDGILGMLGSGVMITGGCARLRDIATLAEDIFDLPVQLTRAREVGGATQTFENPQFSTAIGLTKYAMAVSANAPDESLLQRMAQGLTGIFKKR